MIEIKDKETAHNFIEALEKSNIHKEVITFITHRFPSSDYWMSGNCYYFAVILKARFPEAVIWYDNIDGHFFVQIGENYYDWSGRIELDYSHHYVRWDEAEQYDSLWYERVKRDCIM